MFPAAARPKFPSTKSQGTWSEERPGCDVEDGRDRPELGDLPPRVSFLPLEAGERHEEVLGEELAAADDQEDEADAEGERSRDARRLAEVPVERGDRDR